MTSKETLVERMARELEEWRDATAGPARLSTAADDAKARVRKRSQSIIEQEEAAIADLQRRIEACSEKVAATLHERDEGLERCQEQLNAQLEEQELIIAAKKCAIDETRRVCLA